MTKIRFQTMPARKRFVSLRSEQPSFGGTVQNSKETPSKNKNSFDLDVYYNILDRLVSQDIKTGL